MLENHIPIFPKICQSKYIHWHAIHKIMQKFVCVNCVHIYFWAEKIPETLKTREQERANPHFIKTDKNYPWCLIKYHAMKTSGGVETQLHAFLISALCGVSGYLHTPIALLSRKESPVPIA
jgi:hypothetical protein